MTRIQSAGSIPVGSTMLARTTNTLQPKYDTPKQYLRENIPEATGALVQR